MSSLILLILFMSLGCKAQSVISNKEIAVGTSKYVTDGRVSMAGNVFVKNASNRLWGTPIINGDGTTNIYPPDIIFGYKEKNILKQGVAELFTKNRIEQLISEESFTVHFFLNDEGYPLEVYFFLDGRTKLAGKEIKTLEEYFKKSVRIPLSNDRFKGINYYDISVTFLFKDLLRLQDR